jgi:hypothetical protein
MMARGTKKLNDVHIMGAAPRDGRQAEKVKGLLIQGGAPGIGTTAGNLNDSDVVTQRVTRVTDGPGARSRATAPLPHFYQHHLK